MKVASACALCLLACLPGPAAGSADAGEASPEAPPPGFQVWANPGFLTYHFNRDVGMRGLNWGLGLEADVRDDLSLLGGTYLNSDYARSHYAALGWQPLAWHAIKIGVMAGAVNGYPGDHNGGWVPAALPWVSLRGERVGLNLSYAPNSRGVHRALIAQFVLRVW